jgi:hypothetical protein
MKRTAQAALVVAVGAGLALTLSLAAPAGAAPSSTNGCRILHDLYQDDTGVHAYVEDTCELRPRTLDIYRNGVLFAALSAGFAVNWDHACTCADVTTWSDNWGDRITVPCA